MQLARVVVLVVLVLTLVLSATEAGGKSKNKSKKNKSNSGGFHRFRDAFRNKPWRVQKPKVPEPNDNNNDNSNDNNGNNGKTPLNEKVVAMAKQLLKMGFYIEERARTEGQSGLRTMRMRNEGTRPYHATSHADDYTCSSTHDHPDFYNTCGMGEMTVVLNGVEFTSRHNDFILSQKSRTTREYNATDPIEYPSVPETVSQCNTLEEQIDELREYFRAWQFQDESIRQYKPYFKANLCYLEGAWTKADPKTIQEAFFSERHWYEADSWDDLFQKWRFAAYSGTKDNKENFGQIPSVLWEVTDDGEVVYGQWNYRIYCHPLDDDLPLNRLRGVDDLKSRMSTLVTFEQYLQQRNARFQINPIDADRFYDGPTRHGLLDKLMFQIPGYDNYGQVLHDDGFGNFIQEFDAPSGSEEPLNAAQYHRWFKNREAGALGVKVRKRGYGDENLFMALNTQDAVLPIRVESCTKEGVEDVCKTYEQRWSYAIPLEIVYTTPLNSWNPYGIKYKGYDKDEEGKTVFAGPGGTVRDGKEGKDRAFNGTNSSKYYRTPYEFFDGGEQGVDPADSPKNFVWALDEQGNQRKVRGSGIRTFLPKLKGFKNKIRTRYLIPPIYDEGSPTNKELQALKDIVMNPDKFSFMFRNDPSPVRFPVKLLLTAGPAGHTHDVVLTEYDQEVLDEGNTVTVYTGWANGHVHHLVIERGGYPGDYTYWYTSCGGKPTCNDGHPSDLVIL